MSDYRKILVAVDLSDDSAVVLDKARHLAIANDAELSMVHVQAPLAVSYALDIPSINLADLHSELTEEAHRRLLALGASVDIPASRLHSLIGNPAKEIRELARTLGVDLIVTGGHGKHGFDLLLGSTSTGVAHGVSCDLLIVKLPG
ncbi:MAG: universal stress protein [Pseudomonadota bacterium]